VRGEAIGHPAQVCPDATRRAKLRKRRWPILPRPLKYTWRREEILRGGWLAYNNNFLYILSMRQQKNTLRRGIVRFLVFWSEEDQTWYGYAFEFGLMVNGDTKAKIIEELDEASAGYLESLAKAKIRPQEKIRLLNQKGSKEHEDVWKRLMAHKSVNTKSHGEPMASITPVAALI